jgi:hypothetical protein
LLSKAEVAILDFLIREPAGYDTYPADIERRIFKRVTRAGARLACEGMVKRGILAAAMKRSPTWSKSTPHYRLNEGCVPFGKIVQEYFRTLAKSSPFSWQSSAMSFMDSAFAHRHVTAEFVRDKLSSKKVELLILVKLRERSNTEDRGRSHAMLSFPVVPPGSNVREMESNVKIPDYVKSPGEKSLVQKAIHDHYTAEESKIILSILALIEISPSALQFFLGDWEPYNEVVSISEDSQGIDTIAHVLFRLIWGTIGDLSMTRRVPNSEHVHSAFVSGGLFSKGWQPLLRLSCKDRLSIEYEAGFDTDEILAGGEDGGDDDGPVIVTNNPENCTVRMTVIATDAKTRLLSEKIG